MSEPYILIVEDDIEQLSMLAAMIDKVPYPIETALKGSRALEILREQIPILIITDMVMPDVSGSEIIKFVREQREFDKTKIIVVTSFLKYVSPEARAAADRVLVKPIHKNDMEQAIQELIGG